MANRDRSGSWSYFLPLSRKKGEIGIDFNLNRWGSLGFTQIKLENVKFLILGLFIPCQINVYYRL